MSSNLERIRRLVNLRGRRGSDPDDPPAPSSPLSHATAQPASLTPTPESHPSLPDTQDSAAWDEVPVETAQVEIVTPVGCCHVELRAYPLAHHRGPYPLGSLLDHAPGIFAPYHPAFGLRGQHDYRRAVFLDTETTGLGNGAGVYCFMVGVGSFETLSPGDLAGVSARPTMSNIDDAPTHFVVRQLFMRSPAEERALLVALADLLTPFELTVTFNGRTFDLPLLRSRYQHNRRFLPQLSTGAALLEEDRPHLDLLHPARRLWQRRLQSCRLINLEAQILGLQRSEEDVPGHEIPLLYQEYVRSRNDRLIRRVFYHNAEDIASMVALADHLGRAFQHTPDTAGSRTPVTRAVHGLDWVGLAQAHERAGDLVQAESDYRRALATVRNPTLRADLFRRLGALLKRQERWDEAATVWQDWLASVPGTDPTPFVELAKYSEWRLRDLEQAEMWTAWALHTLRNAHPPAARRPADQAALAHRLARLQRKRAASP